MEYPYLTVRDFEPGMECRHGFTLGREELAAFAEVSHDNHPLHRDAELAAARRFPDTPAHGMLVVSRCSAFVAHDFVGTGGLLLSMSADFRKPVYCGQELEWHGEVTRVAEDAGTVELRWRVTGADGVIVQRGSACAWLPNE